eukprot:scaffold77155_cov19-Tisochrysis_lutea.AAC.1
MFRYIPGGLGERRKPRCSWQDAFPAEGGSEDGEGGGVKKRNPTEHSNGGTRLPNSGSCMEVGHFIPKALPGRVKSTAAQGPSV